MKHILYFGILVMIFSFSGCELSNRIGDEAKRIEAQFDREINRLKNQYQEYVDGGESRGEKPFTVVYQASDAPKSLLISPACAINYDTKYIYFETQADAAHNALNAIANLNSYPESGILKPFWDIRYTNPVSQYIYHSSATYYPNHAVLTGLDARSGQKNILVGTGLSQVDVAGGVTQVKCVDDTLTAGTTLNLYDAPEQELAYGGIANTFLYHMHIDNHIRPWKANASGNLMLQASFDLPIYHNFEENIGGSVSYNIFLYNPKIKKHLNYVIGVYAAGVAWQTEKAGIRFDPTTNIIHVATVIKDDSWWVTKSPVSKAIQEVYDVAGKSTSDDGQWNDFYRANISYQNLLAVLNELKVNAPVEVAGQDFGLSPQDWEVTLVAIQYELEEQGGKASLSGSFKGFETYISDFPL